MAMADNDGNTATSASGKKKISSNDTATYHASSSEAELPPLHNNKRKRSNSNKRKRKRDNDVNTTGSGTATTSTSPSPSATTATATTKALSNNESVKRIFNGILVAISTLESSATTSSSSSSMDIPSNHCHIYDDDNIGTNSNNNNNIYHNYKSLQQTLQHHGAKISPQVHKRVHYLLCTRSAMTHATQRVRQAYKRNVDIVDVAWVKECIDAGNIVDVEKYTCNEEVGCWIAEKEKEKKMKKAADCRSSSVGDCDDNEADIDEEGNEGGWSTPIQLDCCCVCHENGDDACPWCVDCNLTIARKKLAETE